jgi:LacI family transcriptional regulator
LLSEPQRPPTIYDVAERANVSSATVSYVLSGRRSGHSRISDETRKRVLDAVEDLGYAPNQSARNLRLQRTDRVCLALPRLGAPYYEVLAQEVQRQADAHGYTLIITVTDSHEREYQLVDQLRRRLADGAMVVTPRHISANDLASLCAAGLAILLYDPPFDAPGCDVAQTTETEACEEAIAYLIGKGHRRIGLIGSSRRSRHPDRLQCYTGILAAHDIAVDGDLVCAQVDTRPQAYEATQRLLRLPSPPTAILASADILAIGALWAAQRLGVDVPQELAIIGSGNIPEDEITIPPLTTIGPQTLDFGPVVDMLFSRLTGSTPPEGRVYRLPRKLILRGSA